MTEEKPPGLGFEKSYGNIALDLNQEPEEFYCDKESFQGKNISSWFCDYFFVKRNNF